MHAGDSLLYVLSARSEMEWPQFNAAVDSLRTREVSGEPATVLRSRVAQALNALAHVEIVETNGRLILGTCVPALVRLPTREIRAVLAGSRGPSLSVPLPLGGSSWSRFESQATRRGSQFSSSPGRVVCG